jgi:ankyrin repeat protein
MIAAAATEQESASAAFLRAVAAGAIGDIQRMLDATPGLVNAHGPHPYWGGRPQPLHVAIENGRRDIFDLLLARGADIDGDNASYDHWSPLMLAVKRPDMRDDLLRRGVAIGLAEALVLADDERVETLLRSNGLPVAVPNNGSWLAFARTTVAIDLLLAAGAEIDRKDRWGTRPIEAMSRLGPDGAHLVDHMAARGSAPSAADFARLGDIAALVRLAESDPEAATLDSVIMAAVDARQHEIGVWLLERGADPNARSDAPSRHTALHAAAWNGDLRMVRLLLGAGADPHVRDLQYDADPRGWAATSLEVTDNRDCIEVAEYLGSL